MQESELRSLVREMDRMVTDTERLVRTVTNDAGEEVSRARAKAQHSLQAARTHLRGGKLRAWRRAHELAVSAEQRVRSNPWRTLGIAAGIGLLAGVIMSRQKQDA